MSTCRRTRRLLGAFLYDDLSQEEKDYVQAHLSGCPRCAYELRSRKRALEVLTSHEVDAPLSEEFWQSFLSNLDERIADDALHHRRNLLQRFADSLTTLPPALPRVAMAGLSLIVGISVGAVFFSGSKQQVAQQGFREGTKLIVGLRALQAQLQDEDILGVVREMKLDLLTSGSASGLNKLRAVETALLKTASLGTAADLALENQIYGEAEDAFLDEDYEDALRGFRRFVKDNPESPWATDALFMVAFAEEELGNYAQAIEGYQRVSADCPRYNLCENALLRRAECYYRLGQYRQAATALETFTQTNPGAPRSPQMHLMLADIYYDHLEDYAAALSVYNRYATMYAEVFAANPRRGQIAERMEVLTQNARYHWEPLRILAEASKEGGQKAYRLYAKLLSYYPNSGLVDVALDRMSRVDEVPSGRGVTAGSPPGISLGAGPEWYRGKIAAYRRLIDVSESPDVAALAQFKIGDLYETKLGEYDVARKEYEKVLNEYPGTAQTFQAQSRITLLALR